MSLERGPSAALACVNLRPEKKLQERTKGSLRKGSFFIGGISRVSKISKFFRISRQWSHSPLFSRVWGFSKISRISKFRQPQAVTL